MNERFQKLTRAAHLIVSPALPSFYLPFQQSVSHQAGSYNQNAFWGISPGQVCCKGGILIL
jgi:hypothetical protein